MNGSCKAAILFQGPILSNVRIARVKKKHRLDVRAFSFAISVFPSRLYQFMSGFVVLGTLWLSDPLEAVTNDPFKLV